jgi:ribosomal protein S18 acetylase RimI-like enzyme
MSHDVIAAFSGSHKEHYVAGSAAMNGRAARTSFRACTKEDLAPVVEIHQSQFRTPGSLLGRLSPRTIAALYQAFLDRSVFLVHTTDGVVDGFVLGGPPRAILRCRLSFFCRQALPCAVGVGCRPHLWLIAFRSLVKLTGKSFSLLFGAAERSDYCLLSIAVAQAATRMGVGTELIQAFEAAIRGACRAYRLNVLKDNTTAMRFYQKLGFRLAGKTDSSWILLKEVLE